MKRSSDSTPNPGVAALASALLARLPQFADEPTERNIEQLAAHQDMGPVPRDDPDKLSRENLELGLRQLCDAGPQGP
ncbi:MAG: hypothetical protein JOZ49_19885 [Mycolicibacterium sp.]|nr:hypothetical protein [Mycolicibacterium sp.]